MADTFEANLYSTICKEVVDDMISEGINDPIRDSVNDLRERVKTAFNERTTGRELP